MVVIAGRSAQFGKIFSSWLSKEAVLKNEQKFIPCKANYVLLRKAVNLFTILSLGITFLVTGSMVIIGGVLIVIIFKDIITKFVGTETKTTAGILEIFLGLVIAGVIIMLNLPVLWEYLIISISKIKFNKEGMLIRTFFKTKHLPWQQLKNVKVTYLGQNIIFIWKNGTKLYLNFIAYKNIGSIFRCAYKYSSSQSVKDKLRNYYKLFTGYRLPKY